MHQQEAVSHAFDLSLGFNSPSPESPVDDLLRQEEEKLAEALQRSREDARQAQQKERRQAFLTLTSTLGRVSPPPSSSSLGSLRPLSPMADFPPSILASPPLPYTSSLPVGSTSSRPTPRVRVSAASVKPKTAPLRITKQLHDDWLTTKPSPPMLNISSGASRRPYMDPRLVRRFTLVYLASVRPSVIYL